MSQPQWFAGLMTGTVLDGEIDVALIRTDGHDITEFGPSGMVPYPDRLRQRLAECVEAAAAWDFHGPEPAIFGELETETTVVQSDAVIEFVRASGVDMTNIAAIGFHGQTILHRAPTMHKTGNTRQLGDGALMAARTGRQVVYDFRSADMAEGGQGAPLCPVYHAALLNRHGFGPEAAILNLGGIGNITWRSSAGELVGFDTGPANAPINDWIRDHGAGTMDTGGKTASKGSVDETTLSQLLEHPYFNTPFPKSLDRLDFASSMADGLSLEDGAALLTAFAAGAVAKAVGSLPEPISNLILCGGGRHNPALVKAIASRANVQVIMADDLGWRGDSLEAECFAFLAARRLANLPGSFPWTTGVPAPLIAGRIAAP